MSFMERMEQLRAGFDALKAIKSIPANNFLFSSGELVRIDGLVNSTALNGSSGVVKSYLPANNRYVVQIDKIEKSISVKGENLCSRSSFTHHPLAGEDDEACIRNRYFPPGMVYTGTIQIPGEAGYQGPQYENTRQSYRLTVVSHEIPRQHQVTQDRQHSDLYCKPVIIARHRAYEDEQYVFIKILRSDNEDESQFSIAYADGETSCKGTWSAANKCFEGTVTQAVNTDDEIYHQCNPVVHTFSLHFTEEAFVCSRRLTHIYAATMACMYELYNMMKQINPQELYSNMSNISGIPWKDLLEHSMLAVEYQCSLLRYQAKFLDSLEFESPSKRTKLVARFDRSSEHHENDDALFLVRIISIVWINIDPISAAESFDKDVRTLEFIAMERLRRSYDTFSNALSSAEKRLTTKTWNSFRKAIPQHRRFENDLECAICMMRFDVLVDSDSVDSHILLPCGHAFHELCIKQWLHDNNSCPICRAGLTEGKGEDDDDDDDDDKEQA